MVAKDIVKDIMKNKEISQSKLAILAGFNSQSNITGILNRGTTMKVTNFVQMLSVMGYKIMVVPNETPVPEDGYTVDEQ